MVGVGELMNSLKDTQRKTASQLLQKQTSRRLTTRLYEKKHHGYQEATFSSRSLNNQKARLGGSPPSGF